MERLSGVDKRRSLIYTNSPKPPTSSTENNTHFCSGQQRPAIISSVQNTIQNNTSAYCADSSFPSNHSTKMIQAAKIFIPGISSYAPEMSSDSFRYSGQQVPSIADAIQTHGMATNEYNQLNSAGRQQPWRQSEMIMPPPYPTSEKFHEHASHRPNNFYTQQFSDKHSLQHTSSTTDIDSTSASLVGVGHALSRGNFPDYGQPSFASCQQLPPIHSTPGLGNCANFASSRLVSRSALEACNTFQGTKAIDPDTNQVNLGPPSVVLPRSIGPVYEPNENDVLSGRGGRINSHLGNVRFRDIVARRKVEYVSHHTKKVNKGHIATDIVKMIRNLNPPGRFLKEDSNGFWFEIGDQRATKKVGQALREDAAEVRGEVTKEGASTAISSKEDEEDETIQSDDNRTETKQKSKRPTSSASVCSAMSDCKSISASSKLDKTNAKAEKVKSKLSGGNSLPGLASQQSLDTLSSSRHAPSHSGNNQLTGTTGQHRSQIVGSGQSFVDMQENRLGSPDSCDQMLAMGVEQVRMEDMDMSSVKFRQVQEKPQKSIQVVSGRAGKVMTAVMPTTTIMSPSVSQQSMGQHEAYTEIPILPQTTQSMFVYRQSQQRMKSIFYPFGGHVMQPRAGKNIDDSAQQVQSDTMASKPSYSTTSRQKPSLGTMGKQPPARSNEAELFGRTFHPPAAIGGDRSDIESMISGTSVLTTISILTDPMSISSSNMNAQHNSHRAPLYTDACDDSEAGSVITSSMSLSNTVDEPVKVASHQSTMSGYQNYMTTPQSNTTRMPKSEEDIARIYQVKSSRRSLNADPTNGNDPGGYVQQGQHGNELSMHGASGIDASVANETRREWNGNINSGSTNMPQQQFVGCGASVASFVHPVSSSGRHAMEKSEESVNLHLSETILALELVDNSKDPVAVNNTGDDNSGIYQYGSAVYESDNGRYAVL